MKNRWQNAEAAKVEKSDIKLRVFSSRLIGLETALTLPGYGSCSVKTTVQDLLGNRTAALVINGESRSLDGISADDFPAVRMDDLLQVAERRMLGTNELMRIQKAGMLNPDAPSPSLQSVIHAVLPFTYVDFVPAASILTLSSIPDAKEKIKKLLGDSVFILPYCADPVALASRIIKKVRDKDITSWKAIVVLNQGIITFGDTAKSSYFSLIKLVSHAENYLARHTKTKAGQGKKSSADLLTLSKLRKLVSLMQGSAVQAVLDDSKDTAAFSFFEKKSPVVRGGVLLPEQTKTMKPFPLVISGDVEHSIERYKKQYEKYYHRFAVKGTRPMEAAPQWAVWPGVGCVAFGHTFNQAQSRAKTAAHTLRAMRQAENLGGWKPMPLKQIFALEYGAQAALAHIKETGMSAMEFQGKVAVVTGAAAGIGFAVAKTLHARGAAVAGLDLNPSITEIFNQHDFTGMQCDITDQKGVKKAVDAIVKKFGGLDIVVSNAGIFAMGKYIEEMDDSWERSLNVNLTSAMRFLGICIPYLKQGMDPSIEIIGSKNVLAPGAGASAYSVAKAGLNQLARVAALELSKYGIRINSVHPDAVFDTGLWTPEVLARSAKRYGLTVEEYKTRNLMKTEISSWDVANLVCAMAGQAFAKTTGAGVPIDGGNDRVI